ncbi:MlaE family lipid ABC transporter permease subunit [uncultured Roseobacter sp.]|uniref:ABC transporter permease n=1 Tax=uncultured Roseobacter sp. TaxID=114847 RepID=UPI002624D2D9|nr:MlaE family lipid ABC transporter permease subunit [uncultured Roseobacter sp.]
MSRPMLSLDDSDGMATLRLSGRLVTDSLDAVEADFARASVQARVLHVDLSNLEALDTGGAWLIADLKARLEKQGVQVQFTEKATPRTDLIATVAAALPSEKGIEDLPRGILPWIAGVGLKTAGVGQSILSLLSFVGQTLASLATTVFRPRRWRTAALVSQMEETGLNAIPIVVLMSFLIGVVLSFQGASQLRQFGAEVFVVDLIAISILRELGILLTAIIVAGRSGSAFTASIGSMKVREELDAMRTLGLDPIEVLVLPRVIALVIVLPILGFIANISGLLGGALMSWSQLNVSPGMFITRLQENTDVWHLAIGMIKAPVFAAIIAIVACWQAMQVRGSADSVGRHTTISVVQSIFLVIAADALFSIFFAEIGV